MTTKTTTPGTEEGIDLDKLEALLNATTPGPWVRNFGNWNVVAPNESNGGLDRYHVCATEGRDYEQMSRNADFIVAAKTHMAALIALARRAAPLAHPIGQADPMPGASGFTMACFKTSDVPVGTKLYLAPSSTDSAQAAVEEVRLLAYDPNIRWARQRVRLTLKQWDYATTLETTVCGNCQGFEIFDSAISNAWEALPTRGADIAYVALARADGDTLECADDEMRGDDWLKEMVVGIEIVGQEPERTHAAAQAATEGDKS
jgi:hypothetical protein